MEKQLSRQEFAAALEAAGAKLKPEVAADPAKALRKMPTKVREKLLAQLGIPGGAKLTATLDGDVVLLRSAGQDRFAQSAPTASGGGGGQVEGPGAVPPQAGSPAKPKEGKVRGLFKGKKTIPQEQAVPPAPPPSLTALHADGKGPIWKPPLEQGKRELDIYPVNAPHAWVRIVLDEEHHETIYNVLEPPLTEREQRVLAFLEDTLVDVIEIPLSQLLENQGSKVLLEYVNQIIYDYSILLEESSKAKLLYYVERDFLGFGLIDAIMRDDMIEDVSCDGPHVPIFLYHRKYESLKSNVQFVTHDALDGFVIRMAQRSGKHISIAEPLLDATLPDGSRLNATLSDEVTSAGSTYTIRKFRQTPFTPPDLVRFGTMSVDVLAYWWMAVQYGASAIYSGGTASGKTTSLNAILLFIPPTMKIVSIEDTREINLPHPNWIPGITRSGFGPRDANGRQAGEIDMFTLLKAALRQRPEYILVGEVRGQEAFALFQAMATGHTAYGTMHADSVESAIHRLESDPINVPRSLLEALDIVSVQIQTRIKGKRVRRTKELVEIVGLDPHTREILTNTVFVWNSATDEFEYSGVSYVLERIMAERNWTPEQMRQEWEDRKDIVRWLIRRDIRDFKQVAKVITAYYKEAAQVMGYVRDDLAKLDEEERLKALQAQDAQAQAAAAQAVQGAEQALAPTANGPADAPPGGPPPGMEAGAPFQPTAEQMRLPTPQEALEATLPGVIEQAAAQAPEEVEAMARAMEAQSAALGAELQDQETGQGQGAPGEAPGQGPAPGGRRKPEHRED
jgi:archaeal flagellar protein FlaI